MAKRRSSTRVGRKHPRPASARAQLEETNESVHRDAVRRSITRPLLVGEVICRLVYGPSAQIEVQEWSPPYWCPSLTPLYRVRVSSSAPRDVLERHGVPRADWDGDPVQHWEAPELVRVTKESLPSADGDTTNGGLL